MVNKNAITSKDTQLTYRRASHPNNSTFSFETATSDGGGGGQTMSHIVLQ